MKGLWKSQGNQTPNIKATMEVLSRLEPQDFKYKAENPKQIVKRCQDRPALAKDKG